MTQFTDPSNEAIDIINEFLKKKRAGETHRQLIISLYAMRKEVVSNVLAILEKDVIDLSEFMSEDQIICLLKEYPSVVRFLFNDENAYDALQWDGVYKLPNSVVELCLSIAECKPGSKVYLPFAGNAQFAFDQPDCHYEGFESNRKNWAFTQILLSSQDIDFDVANEYGVRYYGELPSENEKKYDYIFAFPPFLRGKEEEVIGSTISFLSSYALKEGGEMYCILPMSFCNDPYSFGWSDLRKDIVFDSGLDPSVLVIALPALFQPYSGIKTCLLHIVQNGEGIVTLVDATDKTFYTQKNKQLKLNVQSVIETIIKQEEKYVWQGYSSDLSDGLNMTPSRYLIPQRLPIPKAKERLMSLGELIDIVEKIRTGHVYKEFPLLGMKELSFSYLNCSVNLSDIPVRQNVGSKVLTKDCFVFGFIGNKFKVGRISGLSQNHPVALRSEVIPFVIKSNDITEDFLLRSLLSKEVEEQALMMATGMTMTRMKYQDFLSIKIIVPTIVEQERICKEDTRASLTEADRKLLESFDAFRKDVHMKKHAIGQTMFNLNNWWKVLQKARKEGNGVVDDSSQTGKIHKIQVVDIYDNLQSSIAKLQQQISTFDIGYGMTVENMALTTFIENYISEHQSPLFKFLYDAKSHHASQTIPEVDMDKGTLTGKTIINEGDPIEYAEFATEALSVIFDNIIHNACSHGFLGRETEKNYVRIELNLEGDSYIILISNNGHPIHRDISPEDVFMYGRTSQNGNDHFGLGGYEILKLMREFGGDAEFMSFPGEEFSVAYKLTFNDTNIVTVEV